MAEAAKAAGVKHLIYSSVAGAAERGEVDFLVVNSALFVLLESRGLTTQAASMRDPLLNGPSLYGGVIFWSGLARARVWV